MTRRRRSLALLLVLGCTRPGEHRFRCPDGTEIGARFHADGVRLRLPAGVAALPVARSASGARYANDTLEYWEHQGAARVALRGSPLYADCRPLERG